MKKFFFFLSFCFSVFTFAQKVTLSKVAQTHKNTDKVFYKINADSTAKIYLGEVEVQGFSDDDAKVFGMIYKKAKEIGANAFAWKPLVQIDETVSTFYPMHYKLELYYAEPKDFPEEKNLVYFIASPYKKQTIAFDDKDVVLAPRTYTTLQLIPGEIYTVSTRKLLGSSIKLSAQDDQPVQYFQFSGFSVNANQGAGIHFKSGDIMKLEKSYAQFLTTIYQFFQK
ncbi:hypothetical protein SAMN05421638_1180 [Kaistella treverensis]|uniref:Uncharacterized protein n=1 Tax=Kaistella treverensis TaxID=631455 RepID=A0A1I3LKN7_9FLAO|nr:hypothetical protein [Kaistella treverensis]SFI85016.1 hypothetical protein SAMN05421638_1180 [Kaistella treverensis]